MIPDFASSFFAAPRMLVMRAEETPNSAAISAAECDLLQPSPKYSRTTFSCCGVSFRKISGRRSGSGPMFMKLREI